MRFPFGGLERWARIALVLAFAALAWPRAWYHDDAFITLRYAGNLAAGHGFVWNAVGGEPVEGSTSLAWTALNAIAIRQGLDPLVFSQALGLAAGALGLLLVARVARSGLGLAPGLALLAPALLFAHRQYVLQAVSAQEFRAATVLGLAATWMLVREAAVSTSRAGRSGLVFFLATLFRPEFPLLHLAAGAGLWLVRPGRAALRAVVRSGALHMALLALLTLARLIYFGQPLPNTFYAKVGGLLLGTGLRFLWQFAAQTWAVLWMPVVLLAAWRLCRLRAPLLGALFAQLVAWTLWIAVEGGDMWEFRLLDPILPALALVISAGVAAAGDLLHGLAPRSRSWCQAGIAMALIGSQAATLFRPFRAFYLVSSAEHHRAAADFQLEQGRALAAYLGPEDRIATGWAGALPWATGAWHLDTYGLNDRIVARRPFDPEAPLYHQRHATVADVVERRVMFVDAFNRFLFASPTAADGFRREPWVPADSPIYAVELPAGRYPWWLFASTRPRAEIEAWLQARGLGPLSTCPPR